MADETIPGNPRPGGTRLRTGSEFAAPPGMHPLGQLDARYPIAYESSVPESMRVLTKWTAALVRRDLDGMARHMHFPFALYEGTEPLAIDSARDFIAKPPLSLNFTGKDDSEV